MWLHRFQANQYMFYSHRRPPYCLCWLSKKSSSSYERIKNKQANRWVLLSNQKAWKWYTLILLELYTSTQTKNTKINTVSLILHNKHNVRHMYSSNRINVYLFQVNTCIVNNKSSNIFWTLSTINVFIKFFPITSILVNYRHFRCWLVNLILKSVSKTSISWTFSYCLK